jgi:putative membrane protein
MMSPISRYFSDSDKERLRAAVQSAERRTSGEIVPYLVERSDDYEVAEWRGGALLAVVAAVVFVLLHRLTTIWLPIDFAGMILTTLFAFGAGMLAVKYSPTLKRAFSGKDLCAIRVAQRAAQAFIAEEVFRTRDRTGVLLFVSLLEHRVLVMADAGINAKVKQEEWDDVVNIIVRGIKRGSAADGIIEAIQHCGSLLHRRGVEIRKDDADELSDTIRLSDR